MAELYASQEEAQFPYEAIADKVACMQSYVEALTSKRGWAWSMPVSTKHSSAQFSSSPVHAHQPYSEMPIQDYVAPS